jgi:hypothetical protein
MKRKLGLGILVLMISGLFYSCYDYVNEIVEMELENNEFVVGVFQNQEDFLKNSNNTYTDGKIVVRTVSTFTDHTHEKGKTEIEGLGDEYNESIEAVDDAAYIGYSELEFVFDLRRNDGWSNWGTPAATGTYKDHEFIGEEESVIDGGILGSFRVKSKYYDDVYFFSIEVNTPPVHLHLCLDDIDENSVNEIPTKSWVVEKILDHNDNPLTDDDDFKYFVDDVFTFQKVDKMYIEPGSLMSPDESDYLGQMQGGKYYGSYTVKAEDDGKVVVKTNFAEVFGYTFTVVHSDFEKMQLQFTTGSGKTGNLFLTKKL